MSIQCACCDLHYDEYELDNVGGHKVCEDCIDGCPHDPTGQNPGGPFICNISGRAIKPNIEQALNQFMASGGAGGHGPNQMFTQGPTGVWHPNPNANQQIQSMLNQIGGAFPQPPAPKKVHAVPDDAQCDKHGGHWGDDETCNHCTDEDGDPKRYRPPPRHLTKTQAAPIDSHLERLKLQLKAGLDDEGRPLKDDERKRLERQVAIEDDVTDEDTEIALAIASILGGSDE